MEELRPKRKIFVTGGTGFIGKWVVKKLSEDKGSEIFVLSQTGDSVSRPDFPKNVFILQGDLANMEELKTKIKEFRPEITLHMAWEGIPNFDSKTSIRNLKYGLDLMNILAEIGCKSILSTGSCFEYGGVAGKLSEETPAAPFNAFTSAKNSLYQLGKEIARENGIQFIWTRLFYVYGPGQRAGSLIPSLINSFRGGGVPVVKNALVQNDFIYVEDVAEAISLLLRRGKDGIYNIGSGSATFVKDIIKLVSDNLGVKSQYKTAEPQTPDGLSDFYADISKIERDAGWKPETSIEEGIKKTIDYFKSVKEI